MCDGTVQYTENQCFLFQNKINCFFGYFEPEKIFLIIKINNFRGELTDISAKKEALLRIICLLVGGEESLCCTWRAACKM